MNLIKNPRKTRRNMNLLFLIFSFIFVFSANHLKASETDILFEKLVYDFGIAGPNQKITHTFKFTNMGSSPLKIEKISTDCGCTAAVVSEREIIPGNTGAIDTVFETLQYEGKQEKTITIYFDNAQQSKIRLSIKGVIKRDVAVLPEGILFGKIEKGETPTGSVKLLQLSPNKLILHKVEADKKHMTVKTSWFKEENHQGFNIDITLKSADVPSGIFSDVITLHTNVKNIPRIDVPVWANIIANENP